MTHTRSSSTREAESSLIVQRACGCQGSCGRCATPGGTTAWGAQAAPAAVHAVLRSPGAPLGADVRRPMERSFGRDFSSVRVHQDREAASSAQAIGARAYTVGQHIVFGASAYAPQHAEGRRLLAHELTHTVQQQTAPAGPARALAIGSESSPGEIEAARVADAVVAGRPPGPIAAHGAVVARWPGIMPVAPPAYQPGRCGRAGTVSVPGFTGTTAGPHISAIDVSINTTAHTAVTLTWTNLAAGTPVPTNPLNASPGAGRCTMRFPDEPRARAVDCSDVADSNTTNSLCTPLGDFTVEGYACRLGDDAGATRVSWFKQARGIAFHNYPSVPAFPASHGCVRMAPVTVGTQTVGGADWIHDNTIPDVTSVHVHRPAGDPGPRCWTGGKLGLRPGYTPPTPSPQETQPGTGPGTTEGTGTETPGNTPGTESQPR